MKYSQRKIKRNILSKKGGAIFFIKYNSNSDKQKASPKEKKEKSILKRRNLNFNQPIPETPIPETPIPETLRLTKNQIKNEVAKGIAKGMNNYTKLPLPSSNKVPKLKFEENNKLQKNLLFDDLDFTNNPLYSKVFEEFDGFVWDFDNTIVHYPKSYKKTTAESGKNISLNNILISKIVRGEISEVELCRRFFFECFKFIKLVLYLVSNQKKVAIMSFGSKNNIKTILDIAFNFYFAIHNIPEQDRKLPFDIDNIYGSNSKTAPYNNMYLHKTDFMEDFIKKHNLSKSKILFFDDEDDNTEEMNKIGVSSITIMTQKPGISTIKFIRGFKIEILKFLNNFLNSNEKKNNSIRIKEDFLYSLSVNNNNNNN